MKNGGVRVGLISDRGTEKNGRDWIASKPLQIFYPLPYWLDHVAPYLMFLSLVSFEFEVVMACHALVSLSCLFQGRELTKTNEEMLS